ncbi:MAG: BspA family leucine-rich repeat surface protein [Bacteroidales bacterium]|nr:BspA family leucine-rich repeat surface protein [Bacteroidales bacterium]
MEKFLKSIFAGAFVFLVLASCSEKENDNNKEEEYDDAYYAAQATVTSSDANFTASDNGGTISFRNTGGSVTLNVSCGCDWLAENNASDTFATSSTNTTLTITADQNVVDNELTGTVILRTANQRITFATIVITQTAYGAPEITVEYGEWIFPAAGTLKAEIAVDATADWTAEAADNWLTVEKTGTGIILTATQNEDNEERSSEITLVCNDGFKTASEYIAVKQDAKAYITLSNEFLRFISEGASSSVTVESNYDWEYSYDTSNGWFTVARNSNNLSVSADANNEDGDREGSVTLTAGDRMENVVEMQLTVTQLGEAAMILTYTITSANTTTKIPIYGTINCTVDWGDGSTVQAVISSQPSHTYATEGEYDIIINGKVTHLYSSNISSSGNPLPLTAVKQWGKTGLTDMQYAFRYCENLVSLPEHTGDAFADVTTFYYAFSHCGITKIPTDIFEKCSEVKTFGSAFRGCSSLKNAPSFENCTKVTTFDCAFYECTSLEEIPARMFNSPVATDISYVFYNCNALKSIPAEGIFINCPKADTFEGVFYNCTSLEEIPEGLFDECSAATNFSFTFSGDNVLKSIPANLFAKCLNASSFFATFQSCYAITEVPAELFANNSAATSFSFLFNNCTALKTIPAELFYGCPEAMDFLDTFGFTNISVIPEGLFDKSTKADDFQQVFYHCSQIKSIPEGLFKNCFAATTFASAFNECILIQEIPKGLFDNCQNVKDFSNTFYNLKNISEIPKGLFDNCPSVETFGGIFDSCSSLTFIPDNLFSKNLKVTNFVYSFRGCTSLTGESTYDMLDGKKVHLYERINYPDTYVTPTSTNGCFNNCTGLTDYYSIPSSWGGGGN